MLQLFKFELHSITRDFCLINGIIKVIGAFVVGINIQRLGVEFGIKDMSIYCMLDLNSVVASWNNAPSI